MQNKTLSSFEELTLDMLNIKDRELIDIVSMTQTLSNQEVDAEEALASQVDDISDSFLPDDEFFFDKKEALDVESYIFRTRQEELEAWRKEMELRNGQALTERFYIFFRCKTLGININTIKQGLYGEYSIEDIHKKVMWIKYRITEAFHTSGQYDCMKNGKLIFTPWEKDYQLQWGFIDTFHRHVPMKGKPAKVCVFALRENPAKDSWLNADMNDDEATEACEKISHSRLEHLIISGKLDRYDDEEIQTFRREGIKKNILLTPLEEEECFDRRNKDNTKESFLLTDEEFSLISMIEEIDEEQGNHFIRDDEPEPTITYKHLKEIAKDDLYSFERFRVAYEAFGLDEEEARSVFPERFIEELA